MAVPQTVGVSAAARILNVSVDTVRRWEAEGKISATRTPGGQRRFKVTDLVAMATGLGLDPKLAGQAVPS